LPDIRIVAHATHLLRLWLLAICSAD
jgi:hypothetical protein